MGAKLYGQELSLKAFEKLLSANDFGTEPKLLSNSYSIFGLLDGKCDVKIECCKNCDKTCSVPATTIPAFLTTPPHIEHQTKRTSRKTPATKKVTSPPHKKPTTPVDIETEATTPATPRSTPPPFTASPSISPRKPIESRKTKPRQPIKVPDSNLLLPHLPGEKPGRVNRMIKRPSNNPFQGPPYIPQAEVTTPRVDHTWKTYAHRDVTFHSQTWQPFVATGTWIPNTVRLSKAKFKALT